VEQATLPEGVTFVGSHPLAGSEKRGPSYADPDLFQGRLTVVTPTPKVPPEALSRCLDFWHALGCRSRLMAPETHDHALALTSHLPHLLASALARTLPADLRDLTATGFRDTTRIAAGDPSVWTGIFLQNRLAVLEALRRFQGHLGAFQQALENADPAAVDALLAEAKRGRDVLGT
jgi:prephenate dehydrogenase